MASNHESDEGLQSARVTSLQATVKTLMVGARQVTLSVFRQLDWCDLEEMESFGRVNDPQSNRELGRDRYIVNAHRAIFVVGARRHDRALVRAFIQKRDYSPDRPTDEERARIKAHDELFESVVKLPLIILAGLR